MRAFRFVAVAIVASCLAGERPRISEDRELKLLDLSIWECRDTPAGSAKTADGIERNELKNRAPIELGGRAVPAFDTAGFLAHVAPFESTVKGKRRKELALAEREQLRVLQGEAVALTGYLVLAYVGPPETSNCANPDFHDWHLEIFERPQDHAPRPGDPTPIICEITPRTQNAIFDAGVRIQKLTGFFRTPDLQMKAAGQPPQRVRVTGLLMWDDEHNGASDVGPGVERIAPIGYHQPWRSTAWELHPVLKIEPVAP